MLSITSKKQPPLLSLLPMAAAILLDAHLRHLILGLPGTAKFLAIVLQLALECTPLCLAHYLAFSQQKHNKRIWLSGFVLYPLSILGFNHLFEPYRDWSLVYPQSIVFALIGSATFFLHHHFSKSDVLPWHWVSRILSLNAVIIVLTLIWALVIAGIFASTPDPMINQPIQPIIKSEQLMARPLTFLSYLLQFSFIGLLVGSVFAINRYVLIRYIMRVQGVLGFLAASLLVIIVITPLFSQLILWLPLNHTEFTLLASGDRNIFSKYNYQFCFAVLAISTPLILAFERQKQDKALIEIAQQKTQTELQLLQQQINPHFLFNTLNNLYALTLSQSDKAPEMVIQLSDLLRYTVYEGQKDRVSLASEMTYIKNYLSLQQMRVSSQCKIKTAFPEQADSAEIAPLLLIILLENAFKHGVEKCQDTCELNIILTLNKHQLQMTCSNTLPSKELQQHTSGLGLNNLKRRLELLYPGKHELTMSRSEQTFTTVLILDLTS
jgi:hypothetical protein